MNFKDKVVLLTGASGGLGSCAARAFAEHGAKLMLVDINAAALEELARSISATGGTVAFHAGDVCDSKDVAKCVEAAISKYGQIDVLINNAGIGGPLKSIVDYDEEDFEKVMRVNLSSMFLYLKHALPHMIRAGKGTVVNTASISVVLYGANQSAYVASKCAVVGLTGSAAAEVAGKGIRVNAICPGPMDTEMLRTLNRANPDNDLEAVAKRQKALVPTGRWSTVEEVTNLMMFLASDLSGNITGQQFIIDGGRTSLSFALAGNNSAK